MNESLRPPSIFADVKFIKVALIILSVSVFAMASIAQEAKTSIPTGEQVDGNFHKVILDADREFDGKWQDTVKDPMELAVAADGRVFYAERAGVIKMWKPDTKKMVVIAKIKVSD